MEITLDDGDFYEFAKNKSNLSDAYSFKIYQELDGIVVSTDNKIENKCTSNNNSFKHVNNDLLNKILRNAKKLNEIQKENIYREYCINYKYWIFREIWKLNKNNTTKSNFSDIISEFINLRDCTKKNHNNIYDCQYHFTVKNLDELKFFIEQKNLYDYFKSYDKVISNIPCDTDNNNEYINYLKSISETYNEHNFHERCCHFGASYCPNYFLSCDDKYNPRNIINALQSKDKEECNKIKNANLNNKSKEENLENYSTQVDMYIKYLECANVNKPPFNGTSIICQHPGYHPSTRNTFFKEKNSERSADSNSSTKIHQIEINNKPFNVALISNDIYRSGNLTPSFAYTPEGIHTLFPEIIDDKRKKYENESEISCKGDHINETMQLYCERSKMYKKLLNGHQNKIYKNVSLYDILNMKDQELYNTPILFNNLTENILFRIILMIILSLGVIMVFFMYYKVKQFSPFGSWLNKKVKYKKKFHKNNFQYKADNIILMQENKYKNIKNSQMNVRIAYNAT
ncbi:variable surface protein [Plasmodium gonderi]|uniref:Variable surface protein n=1 Tax=Plasmodium gonderi TaxID=77519 RepID=A0A1Y1JRV9_PLAGO|nr:variable surface protein [Plasmodium gonderi]GAW83937.1 variable surface protein [Plasmodium gonderi]